VSYSLASRRSTCNALPLYLPANGDRSLRFDTLRSISMKRICLEEQQVRYLRVELAFAGIILSKLAIWVSNRSNCSLLPSGWRFYDPAREYARTGIPSSSPASGPEAAGTTSQHWRVSSANAAFKLCASYPRQVFAPRIAKAACCTSDQLFFFQVVVPASITDEALLASAA
jgi:hypothetical protein